MKTEDEKNSELKESVLAMRNAQKHMTQALDRIKRLEDALKRAADFISSAKRYAPENVYQYNSNKKISDLFDKAESDAREIL